MKLFLALAVLAKGIEEGYSVCREPTELEVPHNTSRLSVYEDQYETDWPLVYKCDKGVGYGYTQVRCKSDSLWTAPSRICDKDAPFGIGSGVGLGFFLFTAVVTIITVILATKLSNKSPQGGSEITLSPRRSSKGKEPESAESSVMGGSTTPRQNGGTVSEQSKDDLQEDRRTEQTEVDTTQGTGDEWNRNTTPVDA